MKLRLSPCAKKDIGNIRDWYRINANQKVANKIGNSIISASEFLTSHPNLGHIEPDLKDFPQCFRTYVLVPNYKIVYWLEDDFVKVATVFDCRQQPEKLIYLLNTRTDWVCEEQAEYGKAK